MAFNLTSALSDLGFDLGDEFGSSTTGAGVGGAVGLGLDLFAANQQKQAVEDSFNVFSRQTVANTAVQLNQLSTARLQERLTAAQQLEDLDFAARTALSSSFQSALESGVSGNSVKALNNAQRLQVDRVRNRIIERQDALDAEYGAQGAALARQAKQSMVNAALSLANSTPSFFQIAGAAAQAGINLADNLGYGPINLDD